MLRPAVAAALAALALLPAAAAAQGGSALARYATGTLAPWEATQSTTGALVDPISGFSGIRYGEAMYAYATLLSRPDAARRASAVRALSWLATQPHELPGPEGLPLQSVFENAAFAASYRLARTRYADDPVVAAALPAWRAWLSAVHYERLGRSGRYHDNKALVEAVAVQELLRTDVPSGGPGTVLADRRDARRRVRRLLNRGVPVAARAFRSERAGRRFVSVSDPPRNPPAYQALAAAYYVRALTLLPRGARAPAARRTARQMLRGIEVALAPDGDLAYWGRSQEQAWALGFAAAAAARAGRAGLLPRREARGLVDAASARLRARHLTAGGQLMTLPLLQDGGPLPAAAVDPYFTFPSYQNLTAMAVGWAAADVRALPRRGGTTWAPAVTVQPHGNGAFAILRSRRVWAAVRGERGDGDLRYDFGVVAAKLRGRDGRWRDLLPPRPRTTTGADSAGPVLLTPEGPAFPAALAMERDGRTVRMEGEYRDARARLKRRHNVRFAFTPTRRGVRMRVSARPGDRFQLSAFSRGTLAPGGRRGVFEQAGYAMVVRGASQRVVAVSDGYASGLDAALARRTVTVQVPRHGHGFAVSYVARR
jgi:hypothetical protein